MYHKNREDVFAFVWKHLLLEHLPDGGGEFEPTATRFAVKEHERLARTVFYSAPTKFGGGCKKIKMNDLKEKKNIYKSYQVMIKADGRKCEREIQFGSRSPGFLLQLLVICKTPRASVKERMEEKEGRKDGRKDTTRGNGKPGVERAGGGE